MPHDFFLSYASLDNDEAIPGNPESRWVSTFHAALSKRLQYYLGRETKVFFDRGDLAGNTALTPAIEGALDGCHLFVAISSPAYYQRQWCRLERGRFIAGLGPKPVEAQRVFVIHTTELPLSTWQAEFFLDLRGYYFFRKDEDKRVRMLGSPALSMPVADASSYYVEIDRLAQDMARRICELESKQTSPVQSVTAEGAIPGAATPDAVFLAEGAFRSHPEREELRLALRDAGFEVRPAATMFGKSEGELATAISESLAFVQIVGAALLEIPGRNDTTYDHQQLEAARAAGRPIYRWRALDTDLDAGARNYPGYKEYAAAADVRQQLLPQFKVDLLAALKDLTAAKRVKQAAAQGDGRLVLVTGEPSDIEKHAGDVTQKLRDHALGHYITESPAEEIQAEDVSGFLVLYGTTTPEWVRDRLRIVRTLPKTRQRDLRVGVYFCDPPPEVSARRLLFDMPSFLKIRWDDPPSFEAFAMAVAQ